MSRRNTVLRRQARKMVHDVHCFLKRESSELIYSLKQLKSEIGEATSILSNHLDSCTGNSSQIKQTVEVIKARNLKINNIISALGKIQKRTAESTNTSIATVRNIFTQANSSDLITVFRTPGKKRSKAKPITNIDNFDRGVIKRCIHNFHQTNNELPTVGKLKRQLEEDINFKGSERSLRRIIKTLGFRWKNTENNRKVLIETSNIRLLRIKYLRKMNQYRQERRSIVFTDESYVDSSHSSSKTWTDGTTKGLKKPISKGQRVVIVHAGAETGFIPHALLTFKAGTKSGDYKDNMNYENYEKWLRTQLMSNLPPNSVVVVDNAAYHNKQWDLAPTSNSKKADMQTWLTEKGIQYEGTLLKPQLYNLIKANKERFKTFSIDRILAEQGHQVLRLPPYHPDLNPIEMAWSDIKQYVGSKNVKWSISKCIELIEEKVLLMGEWDWQKLCKKVKDIEEQYAKSDHVVDLITEEFVIRVDGDSSEESLVSLENVTRLTLSHNKLSTVPAGLANLINLEILNLANNHIEELPVSLSSLPKLRILNVSLNRLYTLPRGFGAFPVLEILDLTYNNLKEETLPGNFFMMESLRALYLGDNDFEYLPPEIGNLKNLQILSMRENDLIEVPRELGQLARLRELHLQGNRLVVLPPEIGSLDLASNKAVLRLEGNFWVPHIEDQIKLGPSHVLDYLRSETYRVLYSRHMSAKPPPPPQTLDKSKKASRARS